MYKIKCQDAGVLHRERDIENRSIRIKKVDIVHRTGENHRHVFLK